MEDSAMDVMSELLNTVSGVVSLPQGNHHVIRNASAALADSREVASSASLVAVQFELGETEMPVLRLLTGRMQLSPKPSSGTLVVHHGPIAERHDPHPQRPSWQPTSQGANAMGYFPAGSSLSR